MTEKEIQASDEEIEQFNISQNEKCVSANENQLSSNMTIQEDVLKLRVENGQLKVQTQNLAKRICELQSDLAREKSKNEKRTERLEKD